MGQVLPGSGHTTMAARRGVQFFDVGYFHAFAKKEYEDYSNVP